MVSKGKSKPVKNGKEQAFDENTSSAPAPATAPVGMLAPAPMTMVQTQQ